MILSEPVTIYVNIAALFMFCVCDQKIMRSNPIPASGPLLSPGIVLYRSHWLKVSGELININVQMNSNIIYF